VSTNVRQWTGLTTSPDGTIYGCILSGNVYQYPIGGPWALVPAGGAINTCLASDSFGNIYGAGLGNTVYIKYAASTSFTPVVPFVGNANWTGLFVDQANTVWLLENNGSIYTKLISSTVFTYYGITPSTGARDITVAPNGDVYVCNSSTIWKQTGGTGPFVALSAPGATWISLSAAPNGDIICVGEKQLPYAGGIWVIYAGTTTFIKIACDSDVDWTAVRAIAGGEFYASQTLSIEGNGEIYIFG
jgi:hypothetical protein